MTKILVVDNAQPGPAPLELEGDDQAGPPKKEMDPRMLYVQASRRRKGVARHKGESFADMARRHGVARRPAPKTNETAEGRQ